MTVLNTPWLVSISHRIGLQMASRRLIRANLVVREGIQFVEATAVADRCTRRYAAGDRVRVRADAIDLLGVIERTSMVDLRVREFVIRVVR